MTTSRDIKGLRILLVDDEEVVRDSLEKLLRIFGATVVPAIDGPAAIKIFAKGHEQFDVALIDQRMPGIGGTETGRRLREHNPSLPLVYISGYCDFSEDSEDEQPVVNEQTGSLDKPVRAEDLLAELCRVTAC